MKRALIGGFLSLLGTIWGLAVLLSAANALSETSSWSTPPGRFLTTVGNMGLVFPLVLALLLLALGLLIMAVEYFKKDS